MPIFTDQLNRTIDLPAQPRRIVSIVPSQTELLWSLGLEAEVVGITKFCVHPEPWFRSKRRVGGTKNVHPDIVASLQPDLIIANKEENVREQVEALADRYPVWISDVNTLEDALSMIRSIGSLTGKADEASELAERITTGYSKLIASPRPLRTAYLIWKDPYMTVGHDTFIHDQLSRCGFLNVFGDRLRYPAITVDELRAAGCELLLLSSEPYPFKEKHIDELQSQLPDTRILLADGEYFSWYGSRLLHAPAYFSELFQRLR
ncbi:helical backbone metal receptor [Paraflavitalea sp. CAU 1676]|uniref:helical backbone metal receptor n=1 Tax=Paraflavitalea sp. CAU 1676 TaxID=3032598 RepID=UPI0023D98F86|nr:helical backbone metal receptor [Paraflavitalea sp. CAU 1676]MDF2192561.1 helical backbone metal receptor [Paraflavitalea sp. CAU 1676]